MAVLLLCHRLTVYLLHTVSLIGWLRSCDSRLAGRRLEAKTFFLSNPNEAKTEEQADIYEHANTGVDEVAADSFL